MRIYRCDRCGTAVETQEDLFYVDCETGNILKYPSVGAGHVDPALNPGILDLCSSCCNGLKNLNAQIIKDNISVLKGWQGKSDMSRDELDRLRADVINDNHSRLKIWLDKRDVS